MSQIPDFAGERSRTSEGVLQASVAIQRFSTPMRELNQWPAAQRENDGVHFMAADSVHQSDKVNESDQ